MKVQPQDIPATFLECDRLIDKLKAEKDGAHITEAMLLELRALGYNGEPPVTKADFADLMDRWKTMAEENKDDDIDLVELIMLKQQALEGTPGPACHSGRQQHHPAKPGKGGARARPPPQPRLLAPPPISYCHPPSGKR